MFSRISSVRFAGNFKKLHFRHLCTRIFDMSSTNMTPDPDESMKLITKNLQVSFPLFSLLF